MNLYAIKRREEMHHPIIKIKGKSQQNCLPGPSSPKDASITMDGCISVEKNGPEKKQRG
jgi:hypothetical protein